MFGNKGQLQALTIVRRLAHVNVQGREVLLNVTPTDALSIPGPPCPLLNIGVIRHEGGNFVNSRTKESHFRFRNDGSKFPVAKKKDFMTLSASGRGNGNHAASAHDFFANRKRCLAFNE